jgi:hypothetical protein
MQDDMRFKFPGNGQVMPVIAEDLFQEVLPERPGKRECEAGSGNCAQQFIEPIAMTAGDETGCRQRFNLAEMPFGQVKYSALAPVFSLWEKSQVTGQVDSKHQVEIRKIFRGFIKKDEVFPDEFEKIGIGGFLLDSFVQEFIQEEEDGRFPDIGMKIPVGMSHPGFADMLKFAFSLPADDEFEQGKRLEEAGFDPGIRYPRPFDNIRTYSGIFR